MKYFNKLVYKIAFAILLPIIVVSIFLSYFLYINIRDRTEEKYIDKLESEVYNYVRYLDKTLENVAYNASKDALFIENTEENTAEELFKITSRNLLSDSIIFGSGIIYDRFMYEDDRNIAMFYSYKTEDGVLNIEFDDSSTDPYTNYLEDEPIWWKEPAVRHRYGWTRPYYDSLGGHETMITYYHPFYFDDEFAGIITMDISLKGIESWLKKNETKVENLLNSTTYLISMDSIILYTNIKERVGYKVFDTLSNYNRDLNRKESLEVIGEALKGETGFSIVNAEDGSKSFVAFYSPLQSTHWSAISVIPYDDIREVVMVSITKTIVVISLFVLFIVIVVIVMTKYISKPIVDLSRTSLKIAEGNFSTRITVTSNDEIGVLANNFKLMKNNLRQREHEIKEANKKYEVIFNNSPVGIVYVDDKAVIISYNQKFVESIVYDDNVNLLGKSVDILKRVKEVEKIKNVLRTGIGITYTTESESRNGMFLKINVNPVRSSQKITGAIITVEDVTNQVKNTELIIKTKAAEEASESKSLFLANMSHEIRTPMNAVIGLSHLMGKTQLNVKQKNYLSKINSSAKMLLGIINDILDFSKIEAGKLSLEYAKFNLESMLIDINNIFSYMAAQKGLEFILFIHPEVPHVVVGDELRLKQIIINLLSNAIKFTEEGEIEVRIRLKKQTKKNTIITVEVRDTGIGMSVDQQEKVFGAFSQADNSTTRKYGGTGLGLSISKRLVELMGGEISLKSTQGEGTSFFFNAILESVDEDHRQGYMPTPDLRGTKVLVCDDNATTRLVISTILKSFTFETQEFENGNLLLETLESNGNEKFDLLILDWAMPGLNGIEVAKKIKQSTSIKHKPKIIFLTAYSEVDFEKEREAAGLDAILYKPVTNSILFDTVMEVFGKDVEKRYKALNPEDEETEMLKDFEGAKVLLVEDNEINQEVATELLESMGMVVEIASNGKLASNRILGSDPGEFNLVFMDLQMPVMGGLEAAGIILADEKFKNIPIVAMTADVMEGVKEECLNVGMKGFVSKPINPSEVVKAIVNWAVRPELPIKRTSKKENTIKTESGLPLDLSKLNDLNIEEGLERVGGNKKLYCSILIKFRDRYTNLLEELNEGVEKGDREKLQRDLHTLKGVAGNIGANQLHKQATLVEEHFMEGIPDNSSTLFLSLNAILLPIVEAIKNAEINTSQETSKKGIFELNDETIAKIQTIINLLDNSDAEGISLLEDLKMDGEYETTHKQIKKALDKYDFDKAVELLSKLINDN